MRATVPLAHLPLIPLIAPACRYPIFVRPLRTRASSRWASPIDVKQIRVSFAEKRIMQIRGGGGVRQCDGN